MQATDLATRLLRLMGRYTQLPEKEILRFIPALKSSRSEISQLSYSYGDKTPLLQLSLFYKSYQHLTAV